MEYELVRSKRKTLSVQITEGKIIVKAPPRMSVEHIENFLNEKSAWIRKKLGEYARKTEMLRPVTDGIAVLYRGSFIGIERTDSGRVRFAGGKLLLPNKYVSGQESDRAVASFFKRLAKTELKKKLESISDIIGLGYSNFALTNAKRQWGSCDAKCNIRLNWRLIMLDGELCDYVIVHELSHTVHHDHSAAFWAEVEKHMPNYAAAKKRIKAFSVLTAMYR